MNNAFRPSRPRLWAAGLFSYATLACSGPILEALGFVDRTSWLFYLVTAMYLPLTLPVALYLFFRYGILKDPIALLLSLFATFVSLIGFWLFLGGANVQLRG